jgi:hypothetical protein
VAAAAAAAAATVDDCDIAAVTMLIFPLVLSIEFKRLNGIH